MDEGPPEPESWVVTVDRLEGYQRVPSEGPVTVELPRRLHFQYHRFEVFYATGTIELVGDRYGLLSLTLHAARPITNELLRSVTVGRLIVNAARFAEPRIVRTDKAGDTLKRAGLTADEVVLVLFHLARTAGENTNVVIAENLAISRSAAAQRVAKLRRPDIGWLPPATKQGAHR
jgi:hypothetical protein